MSPVRGRKRCVTIGSMPRHFLTIFIAVAILIAALIYFGTRITPAPVPIATRPATNDDDNIHIAADRSLSASEYVAAGTPALDRPWGAGDCQVAAKALAKLA